MNSPSRPRSPQSGPATAAPSEAEDSDDDSSSESEGSSSDSSSDGEQHHEPENKAPHASPPKQVRARFQGNRRCACQIASRDCTKQHY